MYRKVFPSTKEKDEKITTQIQIVSQRILKHNIRLLKPSRAEKGPERHMIRIGDYFFSIVQRKVLPS